MDAQDFEASVVLLPAVNKASSDARGARARIAAIPITTASQAFDMSTYLTCWDKGRYLALKADGGDIYFFFSDVNTDTVDNTNTVAGNVTVCWKLANGEREDGEIPDGYKYLIAKASANCTLRIRQSSRRPGSSASQGDY